MKRLAGVALVALVLACFIGQLYAGPIIPNPPGGPWYEFGFTQVGVPATGAFPADPAGPSLTPSGGGNSIFADAPPWTFTGWSTLTVTDAFMAGDVFQVFDFGVPVGITSAPVGSPGAYDVSNPALTSLDPAFSTGAFNFGPGAHSMTITPTVIVSPGAGYFRLDEGVIPEPCTFALLGLGGLALLRRRRKR